MDDWGKYKAFVKEQSSEENADIESIELLSTIVSLMIKTRHANHISQRELAKRCGITQAMLGRVETMKCIPRADTLFKIMLALKLAIAANPAENPKNT